jgi:hypothetical protein
MIHKDRRWTASIIFGMQFYGDFPGVAGTLVQVKNDGVTKTIPLIGKDEENSGRDKQRYQEPEFRPVHL